MDLVTVLYLIYVFVLSCWNSFAGGVRLSSKEAWDKIAGTAGMLIGMIGLGLGISILFGVNILLTVYIIAIPLVGLCIIITIDSWIIYKKTRSFWVLLIAIYNTVVTIWNIISVVKLFKNVKARDIGNIAKAGTAGAAGLLAASQLAALLVSLGIGAIMGLVLTYAGYKTGIKAGRKIPDRFKPYKE